MAVRKKFTTTPNGGHHAIALGKGLDALIDTSPLHTAGAATISAVPLANIVPNPQQPRRTVSEEGLADLVASIRAIGVIQPITLHETSPGQYVIIAGERRWRAAQLAGLTTIPAYITTLEEGTIMEMALVENIQREDLNVIEVALAYQSLLEQEGMTQEKVAQRVGKGRTVITNTLRLLRLPGEVQMALQKGHIDMGHARALLALDSAAQQVQMFREILELGYSVREVERIVQRMKGDKKERTVSSTLSLPPRHIAARDALRAILGPKVVVARAKNGKGRITISFASDDDFDKIVAALHLSNE